MEVVNFIFNRHCAHLTSTPSSHRRALHSSAAVLSRITRDSTSPAIAGSLLPHLKDSVGPVKGSRFLSVSTTVGLSPTLVSGQLRYRLAISTGPRHSHTRKERPCSPKVLMRLEACHQQSCGFEQPPFRGHRRLRYSPHSTRQRGRLP